MSFEFPIRVYWEDTDAGGIVFYANYLKFFERARTEWLRHLGIEQQALREATGGMFVVVETQLKYHKPAQLDDLLSVNASLLSKGRSSLIITQQFNYTRIILNFLKSLLVGYLLLVIQVFDTLHRLLFS